MEKRMRREANINDMPLTFYSSLPRKTLRVLRKKSKDEFQITEIRLGKVMLYFADIDVAAYAYIYPKERTKDNTELVYEQCAKDSVRGRDTAAFLEKNEVVFNGGEFDLVSSGHAFHAGIHRVLATEMTNVIEDRVEEILAGKRAE